MSVCSSHAIDHIGFCTKFLHIWFLNEVFDILKLFLALINVINSLSNLLKKN